MKKNKRGMENEILAYWIIAIVVLVIIFAGFFIIKDKGIGAIDYLKSLFSFGR
jgi:hypothetical protein